MTEIVHYEELREIFGGQTIADLCARMEQREVRYILGKKGRPFTTTAAINAAMRLQPGPEPQVRQQVEIG